LFVPEPGIDALSLSNLFATASAVSGDSAAWNFASGSAGLCPMQPWQTPPAPMEIDS
jgi:hypothetical protein